MNFIENKSLALKIRTMRQMILKTFRSIQTAEVLYIAG